jgi:hypothetical protein
MRTYSLTEAEVRIIMLLRRTITDSHNKRDRRIITIEIESKRLSTGLSVMRNEQEENTCSMPATLLEYVQG